MQIVLVQPDQLSMSSGLLRERRPEDTVIILIEATRELTEVPFHKQRLIFVLSAMRHFAKELKSLGFTVVIHRLCDDPVKALRTTLGEYESETVTIMRSASWGADDAWAEDVRAAGGTPNLVQNDMFISARRDGDFALPRGRSVRMETFYRKIRAATGILMDGGKPEGGQWNYDRDNRRAPAKGLTGPDVPKFEPDSITQGVIEDVEKHFADHFGNARPFGWPVTRADAETALDDFFERRFSDFGTYQDAMVEGEDTLYHSLLSVCLNVGLLDPEEVCKRAEAEYRSGRVPLNSAEGFIRQILGWREFVYQLYRANMPGYDDLNELDADQPLPEFYWDGDTRMRCLAESIRPVVERGLSHHIQRLMVTGNFGLLAGVSPQELNRWYWLGFVDAWHWVVTPNVVGMATYADGGLMATKPYAASANYIHRMSDYCAECPYDPKKAVGDDACPMNTLYWDFLDRNKRALSRNPRMTLSYRNFDQKRAADVKAIRKRARSLRDALAAGERL